MNLSRNQVEVINLVKKYHNHLALDQINLSVPKGSIFALLGPNGAGKTSLIRILTQIIDADSGSIKFDGENLSPRHLSKIGYLPEERGLYKKMSAIEQLLYLTKLRGLNSSDAKKNLNTWFEKLSISDWKHKKVEDLSKGMQQKLQFIATVVHDPTFIILDEPFTGFDPINAGIIKREIVNFIKEGKTVLLSTHRMESVEELCDHICFINNAKVILQGFKSVIKNKFKHNTFQLTYRGELIPDGNLSDFQIVNKDDKKGTAQIQLLDKTKKNEMIHWLNQKIDIMTFNEDVPSINDIFINLIN